MKILIDIGHPAHVHLFKHIAWNLQRNGHIVLFSVRKKDQNVYLLKKYGFDFILYGSYQTKLFRKIWGLLKFNLALYKVFKLFRPNITISHSSFYLSQISFIFGIKNITLEDTGNMEQIALYKLFTNIILSPDCYKKNHGYKHILYRGYHELAYLHTNNFEPNKNILKELGLKNNEKFCLVRFVSWDASHDINHKGISQENKILLVQEFSKYAKVFISSQIKLPDELEQYKFPLSPEKIHHALAYASLIFGESATMISEGAVLGVPGIYLDNTGRYYTTEQENKYGIVFNYSESLADQKIAILKGIKLLSIDNAKFIICENYKKLLSNKIDVSSFMVWFIENFPESARIMQENPDYQNKFK